MKYAARMPSWHSTAIMAYIFSVFGPNLQASFFSSFFEVSNIGFSCSSASASCFSRLLVLLFKLTFYYCFSGHMDCPQVKSTQVSYAFFGAMWPWFDLAGVDWLILTGRAAYVAIVFMFLLVVSVRVPWQTRSADWLVLGSRTMTVTLTRREGRRTPSLLRYSLELVAQFATARRASP